MSDLVGNPEDRFSHNEAHIIVEHVSVTNQTASNLEKMQKAKYHLQVMLIYGRSFLFYLIKKINKRQNATVIL